MVYGEKRYVKQEKSIRNFWAKKKGKLLAHGSYQAFSFSVLLLLCLSLWEVIIELPEERVAIGSLFRNANVSHELHLRPVFSFEEKRPPPFFFSIFWRVLLLASRCHEKLTKGYVYTGLPRGTAGPYNLPLLPSLNPFYNPSYNLSLPIDLWDRS